MSKRLDSLIRAVRDLSTSEQLQLIRAVTELLDISCDQDQSAGFLKPKSIEEIIEARGIPPVSDLSELAGDFWPEDESSDVFIDYIYKQRQEDRLRNS
ncbi:MAG: hypothetical protein P4L55_03580 [Syntrophobacteraceae bacterium]|nr:hypothetical protein [Syntrophobacteraceae bacterium]